MILILRTSQDASFSVTLDGDGNGFLHAHPEGLCDKVRIRDWSLDNEDGFYLVDSTLTSEWDDLIDAHFETKAQEWAESRSVVQRIEVLREIKKELREFDAETGAARAKIVSRYRAVFQPLHTEASMLLGIGTQAVSLNKTYYSSYPPLEVDCIEINGSVLAEDISDS